MKKRLLTLTVALLAISGCDKSKNYSAELQAEKDKNQQLTEQLANLKQNPATLLAEAKNLLANSQPEEALTRLEAITRNHVSAAEYIEASELADTIEKSLKVAAENEMERKRKERAESLNNLAAHYDKVTKTTWYKQENQHPDTTHIRAYIGQKEGSRPWLRQHVHYFDDKWLFVKGYTMVIDGETFEYPNAEFKRDSSTKGIWEWEDKLAFSKEEVDILRKIANSKETIIRYQGSTYYYDYYVVDGEKDRLKDVLIGYDALTEEYSLNNATENP